MAMTARDLEGSIGCIRKKLFYLIGVLRVSNAIAEQHHAVFGVSRLPGVQEVVRGGQCKDVTRVGGNRRLGRMGARSSPDWRYQKDRQKGKAYC